MSSRIHVACRWVVLCCLTVWLNLAQAQFEDNSDRVLSEQETQRLTEVLNQPVDPNSLNLARAEKYREKVMAAQLLGDRVRTGQLLKEWLAFEPTGDAKWKLVEWYWYSGQRDESLRLCAELIQERRDPTSNVRLRSQMAYYLLQDGNMADAVAQINKAEEVIKYEFRSIQRRGAMPYWIARAEVEFQLIKSEIEAAQGAPVP